MRLVLRNEADPLKDISLSGDTILVGHESTQCQLCLALSTWPMVARLHAEFRTVNGVCYLFDLKSGSGTYVDGRKITQSIPVRVGSQIRFGSGGPLVIVQHVEVVDSMPPPVEPIPDVPPEPNIRPEAAKIVLPPFAKTKRAPIRSAYIEVVSDDPVNLKRLDISKDVVRLGRSPEVDLIFDGAAAFISRIHAEIRRDPEGYVLFDLDSFNGTLLDGKRITRPSLLQNGDTIQLGSRGPTLRFHQAGLRLPPPIPAVVRPHPHNETAPTTTYVKPGGALPIPPVKITESQPIYVLPLNGKSRYLIGRTPESDVKLDGLQISKRHAWLTIRGPRIFIEDNNSTNGVYVNGVRLVGEVAVDPPDAIQVGPFLLYVDPERGVEVFDTRAKMRIDSVGLTKVVASNVGSGNIQLLDNLSFTIQPNEFVGLLGPSGAGKSTLIDALNGMRPASAGQVLINNLDLYRHLNWLKQAIGYVPQDDIIHRELTVYRTLYYVAKLRLSGDVSESELDLIVNEVLDVTGLTERTDVPVAQLSGGQRKRVSVAVELLTKPSVIYLDEPTSGLDPATEEKIMLLFRQIADSGHTIVLTTHAMENVRLFDKVVVLMQGKLVFYGAPSEALSYVKAKSFKEFYDKLEEPITDQLGRSRPEGNGAEPNNAKLRMAEVREKVAETWKQRYLQTPQYERNVREPQRSLQKLKPEPPPPKQGVGVKNGLRQCAILGRRYGEVLKRDRTNLMVLFGQAPVIACLTWLAVAANSPRDFPYFFLALVPIWFGTSVAAREIIRERAIYNRERMVNLGIWPYVGSKLAVLTLIVSLQCLILFGTLRVFTWFDLLKLPALFGGLPQLVVMILTGMVGIALGLLVSSGMKTSEMATSLVPLLLIPQILFSGLIGVPKGVTKTVGVLMPVTWSFDEMKRLSATDVKVLQGKDEGAEPAYNNEGRGLYKQVRHETERAIEEREQQWNDYRVDQEDRARQLQKGSNQRSAANRSALSKPPEPDADSAAEQPAVSHVPDDLSDYVSFLNPLGSVWLNPIILLLMFFGLVAATVLSLRRQDIG